MKKIFLIAFVFICTQVSFAAFPPLVLPGADSSSTQAALPQNFKDLNADQKRQLMEQFSKLSLSEFEQLTGKKLKGVEKLSLKLTQQRMKHQLKKKSYGEGLFSNFNVGGLLLGFLLGLIGVLLAYLFSKDADLRKWTWIGLGFAVVLYVIIFALA